MKDLFIRSITGLIFVLAVTGGLIFSKYGFVIVFTFFMIMGMWEFYKLCQKTFSRPQKHFGIIIGVTYFIANYLYVTHSVDIKIFVFLIPLIFALFVFELYRKSKRPFNNIAYTILGIVYIAIPFSLFNYFVFNYTTTVVYDYSVLLGFFILIWINDSGAYLVGVSIGTNRLFERISPKKSWEGFIGGLVFTVAIAYFLSTKMPILSLEDWIVIGLIISVSATFGDLVESMFKRSINIKDSGKILPGHGGILDRFDGVLFAAPIVFMYLTFIE